MFDAIILAVASLNPPDLVADCRYPLVRIADAREFAISPDEARAMLQAARDHRTHHEQYLLDRYQFADVMAWRVECEKRRDAWDALDNVIHPSMFRHYNRVGKLGQLDRLRRAIGDENYNARIMPAPSPGHMFRD